MLTWRTNKWLSAIYCENLFVLLNIFLLSAFVAQSSIRVVRSVCIEKSTFLETLCYKSWQWRFWNQRLDNRFKDLLPTEMTDIYYQLYRLMRLCSSKCSCKLSKNSDNWRTVLLINNCRKLTTLFNRGRNITRNDVSLWYAINVVV